jgi:acyl-CoA dehydrogenase
MSVAAAATREERLARIRTIGREVAARYADEVDAGARFPAEALAALRAEGCLGAAVPERLGGGGASLGELAAACAAVAQGCASAGMVLAMHHIQVACLARHAGASAVLNRYLQDLVEHQWLLASITSEVGTSGDIRSSVCAVVADGGRFTLRKEGTTGSYCEHADGILVTARRHPDAPPNDQVLVLIRHETATLTRTTTWDTLGMRGTCSPGFGLDASGPVDDILPAPFADIVARTMVPYSHVLWASVWSGIAAEAVARAAAFVRADARRKPGTTPIGAARLARAAASLQTLRSHWAGVAAEIDRLGDDPGQMDALTSMAWSLRLNNLKIAASEAAPAIVHEALQIVGLAGYKNDSKFSMGRLYRDALSASLMISNDRIAAASGSMWLVFKDE